MTHSVGVRTELRGKQASTSGMARMQASYLHVREATLQVVKGGTVDQWDGLCKETVICFPDTLWRQRCAHCWPVRPEIFLATIHHLQACHVILWSRHLPFAWV